MARGAARTAFDEVAAEARRAAELAEALGSPPLADHLLDLAGRAMAQGRSTDAHFARVADRATSLLFRPGDLQESRELATAGP
jgi:hypothetical protein